LSADEKINSILGLATKKMFAFSLENSSFSFLRFKVDDDNDNLSSLINI
jgi:hypothetical protein